MITVFVGKQDTADRSGIDSKHIQTSQQFLPGKSGIYQQRFIFS
jgi:hypothetical protein